jgi:hypothetical protein
MRIVLITVNSNPGVTLHSFACKYYYLIAILKGEPRGFEPRPHLKASRQTQLKVFLTIWYSSCPPQWCSGYSAGKLHRGPKFKSLTHHIFFFHLIDYEIICIYNLYNFSLTIVNKLEKRGKNFK